MKQPRHLPWASDFYKSSPIFTPLVRWAENFSHFKKAWPTLIDYQRMLDDLPQPILTADGQVLRVVHQEGKPHHFKDHYAPRIYLTGEIQTRKENWHDFFQLITWLMFPKTKAVINAIHVPAVQMRLANEKNAGHRTAVENMLSLFDEGGAVILCSDYSLLDLIREFKWKTLFWQRRSELSEKLQFVTFGHALYEKSLSPYVGMTANCILLHVNEDILNLSNEQQLNWIDSKLAKLFLSANTYKKPKDLSPFPLLGLPNWDENNKDETYYDNVSYFRVGRVSKSLV